MSYIQRRAAKSRKRKSSGHTTTMVARSQRNTLERVVVAEADQSLYGDLFDARHAVLWVFGMGLIRDGV